MLAEAPRAKQRRENFHIDKPIPQDYFTEYWLQHIRDEKAHRYKEDLAISNRSSFH